MAGRIFCAGASSDARPEEKTPSRSAMPLTQPSDENRADFRSFVVGGGCRVGGRLTVEALNPHNSLARTSLRTRYCCPRALGSTRSKQKSPRRRPPMHMSAGFGQPGSTVMGWCGVRRSVPSLAPEDGHERNQASNGFLGSISTAPCPIRFRQYTGSDSISERKRQAIGCGRRFPCSHDRTVLTLTPRNRARTAWLAPSSSRTRLTSPDRRDARCRWYPVGADRQPLALEPFSPQDHGCLLDGGNNLRASGETVSGTPHDLSPARPHPCFRFRTLHILAPLNQSPGPLNKPAKFRITLVQSTTRCSGMAVPESLIFLSLAAIIPCQAGSISEGQPCISSVPTAEERRASDWVGNRYNAGKAVRQRPCRRGAGAGRGSPWERPRPARLAAPVSTNNASDLRVRLLESRESDRRAANRSKGRLSHLRPPW